MDPRLEGERALHFLETLPPAALFSDLLAVGYSAAVQLLGAVGPAAQLPAVRRQLECLAAAAGPELQQGVAATLGVGTAKAVGEPEQQRGHEAELSNGSPFPSGSGNTSATPLLRQPSWLQSVFCSGVSSSEFRRVLLLLGCAEQTVVAAHSLLQRLRQQGERRGSGGSGSSSGGSGKEFAATVASGLIAAALGEQLHHQAAVGTAAAVELAPAHWPEAEVLLVAQQAWARDDDEVASTSASSSRGDACWPGPFQQEWLWQVQPGGSPDAPAAPSPAAAGRHLQPTGPDSPQGIGAGSSAAPAFAAASSGVLQRMYVKALPAEVRIATVLSSDL